MANIVPIGFLDPTLLGASLVSHYHRHFDDDTRRQEYAHSPHKHTKTILLRGPDNAGPENWYEDVAMRATDLLREWREAQEFLARAESMISRAIQVQELELGKIMIVRLAPGSAVDWHIDQGSYAEAHLRFHVTLLPSWGAYLMSGGESVSMTPGNLFMFNNRALHCAVNFGDIARINMIIDARRPRLQ